MSRVAAKLAATFFCWSRISASVIFLFSVTSFLFLDSSNSYTPIHKNIRTSVKMVVPDIEIVNRAAPIVDFSVSPNGYYFATLHADGTYQVWSLLDSAMVGRYATVQGTSSANFEKIVVSNGGGHVFLLSRSGTVIGFEDGNRYRVVQDGHGSREPAVVTMRLSDDGSILLLQRRNRIIEAWSVTAKTLIFKYDAGPSGLSFDLDPTNTYLAVLRMDGTVFVADIENKITAFSASIKNDDFLSGIYFNGTGETLSLLNSKDELVQLNVKTKIIKTVHVCDGIGHASAVLESNEESVSVLCSGDVRFVEKIGEVGGQDSTVVSRTRIAGSGASVKQVGRDAFAANTRDSIDFFVIGVEGKQVSAIPTNMGWLAVDKTRRFDTRPNMVGNISWKIEGMDLSGHHLMEQYYEPGLLRKHVIRDIDILTKDALELSEGVIPPPLSMIVAPKEIEIKNDDEIEIAAVSEDRGSGVDETLLFHNGRPVGPDKIFKRTEKAFEDRIMRAQFYRIQVSAGDNVFTAFSRSSTKLPGPADSVKILVKGRPHPGKFVFFSVSVDKYADPALDLEFAVKDARSVAGHMRNLIEKSGSEFYFRDLINENSTKNNFMKMISSLVDLNKRDTFFMFLSGHGFSYGGEWYFVPYGLTRNKIKSKNFEGAISTQDLYTALSKIEAGKIVLVIDACSSGVVASRLRDFVADRAFWKLGQALGIYVIAATTQSQSAVELFSLGHGAFSYAIIQGLSEKADNRPHDGVLTAHELAEYAIEEVPKITKEYAGYAQAPFAFSTGYDFGLARLDR